MGRSKNKKRYAIMDARAINDIDDALVLDMADSMSEARKAAKAQGDGNCIVKFIEVGEHQFDFGDVIEIVY